MDHRGGMVRMGVPPLVGGAGCVFPTGGGANPPSATRPEYGE